MAKKGLVVPDNPTPEDWKYVPLYVPDDPQWLGIITGLLFSPCNGYWWKKSSGDWEAARDTACLIGAHFVQDNFCEQVGDCIRDDDGVREIIREIIKETTICDPTTIIGEGNPVFAGCNPDVIFGATTSIVDILNVAVIDTFEIIEVATNVIESINLLADNAPIVGQVASSLIETIDWIIANIAENYAANYTAALRDEYRCDLFCLWYESENCELSIGDVANYFAERLGSPDPLDKLDDILLFLIGGVWLGTEIVDTMHLLGLALLAAQDAIGWSPFGNGYTFNTAAALGANSPDPDWTILCTACNSGLDFDRCWYGLNTGNIAELPTVSFIGNSGYPACVATVNGANEVEGCRNGNVGGQRVWSAMLRFDVPPNVQSLTRISASYQTNSVGGSSTISAIQAYNSSDVRVVNEISSVQSTTYDWNGDRDDIAYFTIYVRCYRTDELGFVTIDGVRLEGQSTTPYTDGCV